VSCRFPLLSHTYSFRSHDWGHKNGQDTHAKVKFINSLLRERGLKTWFDEEHLQVIVSFTYISPNLPHRSVALPQLEMKEEIVSSLERSATVVIFLTQHYFDLVNDNHLNSPNNSCLLEWTSASTLKPKVLIPVVLEEGLERPSDWSGSIGLLLGGTLSHYLAKDFEDVDNVIARVDQLEADIRKHIEEQKRTAVAAASAAEAAALQISTTKPLFDLTVAEVSVLLTNHRFSQLIQEFQANDVDGALLDSIESVEELLEIAQLPALKAKVLLKKIGIWKADGVPLSELVEAT
jgi:hypothetical protein